MGHSTNHPFANDHAIIIYGLRQGEVPSTAARRIDDVIKLLKANARTIEEGGDAASRDDGAPTDDLGEAEAERLEIMLADLDDEIHEHEGLLAGVQQQIRSAETTIVLAHSAATR